MDCDQLAVEIRGLVKGEQVDQLYLEVSNAVHVGHLYYYPGFVLLSEAGDTIAKEETTYYGISTGFQSHLLKLHTKITFPFSGRVELFGSFYQKQFCSFPVYIEGLDYVTVDRGETPTVKVATNMAETHLILDLGSYNQQAESLNYYFNITDELGNEIYSAKATESVTAIPTSKLGVGFFLISIWDGVQKKLLPAQLIEIEE